MIAGFTKETGQLLAGLFYTVRESLRGRGARKRGEFDWAEVGIPRAGKLPIASAAIQGMASLRKSI